MIKIFGPLCKPHIVLVGGLWRVRWTHPNHPGEKVHESRVHYATLESNAGRAAKIFCANRNARLVAAGQQKAALLRRGRK